MTKPVCLGPESSAFLASNDVAGSRNLIVPLSLCAVAASATPGDLNEQ
jgi:hypothetical protein